MVCYLMLLALGFRRRCGAAYTRAGAGRCELPALPAVFYCDEGNLRIKEKSAQAARPHGKAFVKHLRHVHNKHTVSVPVAYGAVYT